MKKRWMAGILAAALTLSAASEAGAMSLDGQLEAVAVEAFTSEPEAFSEAAPEQWPLEEPVIVEPEEVPLEEASPEETADAPEWQPSAEDVAGEAFGQPAEAPAGALTGDPVFSSGEAPQMETAAAPNTWQWDPAKGAFTYYDGQGSPVPVSALAAGNPLGYFEINGSFYCLDGQGVPRTGEITLTPGGAAADYYFIETPNANGIPGEMVTGWRVVGAGEQERWLYYDTGSKNPADRGKLFVHGVIATKLDTARKGEELYLLDRDGTLLRKAKRKAENGRIYLTDSQGRVYKNRLVTYEGSQYYVGKSGAKVTWKKQWHRCSGADDRLYYFGKTPGKVVKKTGWQKVMIKGKFYGWFYFAKNGKHYQDRMLKSGLYFKENGKLASGVTLIDGNRYFFTVSTAASRAGKMVKNQLVQRGNSWYYAGEDGRLKKSGWRNIGGIDYYFKDYKMVRNTFVKKGSVKGYLDNTGRFTTGWVIENDSKNRVRYVDAAKGTFVKNTSRVINGLTYFFDKDGYRINDVTDRVAGPYSLVADRVNGVMTVYNANRTIPVRSIRISVGLPNTPTPVGTFRLTPSARWQPLMGNSWGQYGTHVTGNVLVHSVPGGSPDPYQLPAVFYNLLGQPASHGCIRVCVADAKWVYERCAGAAITILDGAYRAEEVFKGPLGKPPLVPLVAPYNYDPTDPALKENQ